MNAKNFYYIRVSTKEQNISRQLDALKSLNIDIDERNIFIDKSSGKNFEREQYQLLKRLLRAGDCLYIKSIDRLGRNYSEILSEWKSLISGEVDIIVLDMPLLNTKDNKDLLGTLISDIVLQLLSYVAATELANIKLRQQEGIAAAHKAGIKFGRPKQFINYEDDIFLSLYTQWKSRKITSSFFMKKLDVKPNTFYRRIREYEKS